MSSPCYDEKTHVDCPDRCIGCHSICEKWKEHEKKKEKQYAENKEKYRTRIEFCDRMRHYNYKLIKQRKNYKWRIYK